MKNRKSYTPARVDIVDCRTNILTVSGETTTREIQSVSYTLPSSDNTDNQF